SAPCGPAPWIGVLDPRGRGVLVIFFDAEELAEAPRQVPPHVLWRVLSELCQLMPDPPGFVPSPENAQPLPPKPEFPAPRRTSRLKPRSI
ncbi:MAG TPA: hypothetical protein VNM87_05710, partial [Candidatus Udaeobacter sp.]|nr:hypothetical protein [Candidatus Udaeobacter sp.]